MKLYKVLQSDMRGPFQGFQFKVEKWYHCKDFDKGNRQCSRGFYATGVEGLTYAYRKDTRVFECEVKGKSKTFDIYKQRYEYIRLGRELSVDEIKALAKAEEEKCGYKLYEALFPFNPLTDANPRNRVTKRDIGNLKKWASVRYLVKDSIWDSVWSSALESVRGSVWISIWNSAWNSVRDSFSEPGRNSAKDPIYAYTGSLFLNVKKWKHIDHKEGEYPFQCLVDLWYRGFVPSFDGKNWRLHQGKDAKVVYEEKK